MNAPARVKLGDCVRLAKGKPPGQQPYYGADSTWYLSPDYLRGASACERAKPRANALHVQDGDTILLWDGSNAGEVFLGREGMLASTMTLVSPDNRFTSDYFFFALKHWEPYLKGQTSGSGIPHVDKEVLSKLEITKFAESEQSKIAEVLSTVDRAIAQTEALIAKQQLIKTGLMQDLLTRGIDEQGQLRSEATHTFKDSPLGRIPVDWEVKTLSEVISLQVGYAFRSSWFAEEGIRLLRGENVGAGETDWRDTQRLPMHVANKYRDYILEKGDLIIGMDRTFTKQGFKVSRLRDNDVPCLLVQRVGRFVPKGMPAAYMRLWIQSSQYRRELLLKQKGMDIPHLSKDEILSPPVAVPDTATEMDRIGDRFRAIGSLLESHKAQLNKLRHLKTALMQDLLTGKVRVTPLLQQAKEAVSA